MFGRFPQEAEPLRYSKSFVGTKRIFPLLAYRSSRIYYKESALADWFEAKKYGIRPFQYINSIGIRSWETDLIYFSLYAAKAC
jgi:hypothetical protein